jgi:hypothetical protein
VQQRKNKIVTKHAMASNSSCARTRSRPLKAMGA